MNISRWLTRVAVGVLVLCSIVLFGVWRSSSSLSPAAAPTSLSPSEIPVTSPQAPLQSGKQLLVIFIGSSTCGASSRPELAQSFKALRASLASEAKRRDARVTYMGVATDWSIQLGLGFLSKYGPFDQVNVGANWLNNGIISYVWRDIPGQPLLPQVLVVERTVVLKDGFITVSDETLLTRKLGVDEVVAWSKAFRL